MLGPDTFIIALFVLCNILYFMSLLLKNRNTYLVSMSLYFIVAADQCWKSIRAMQYLQGAGVIFVFIISLSVGKWLTGKKPVVKPEGGKEDDERA